MNKISRIIYIGMLRTTTTTKYVIIQYFLFQLKLNENKPIKLLCKIYFYLYLMCKHLWTKNQNNKQKIMKKTTQKI